MCMSGTTAISTVSGSISEKLLYTAIEGSPVNVILDPAGSLPPGMVHVPAGRVDPTGHFEVKLDDFLIDKFEVTNREFKKFVDAGGYRERKYWKLPFLKD